MKCNRVLCSEFNADAEGQCNGYSDLTVCPRFIKLREEDTTTMSFGNALDYLKSGSSGQYVITRKDWYGSHSAPVVKLQKPDINSKMTEPYLYMEKHGAAGNIVRFPLDLSCESILADNWMMVLGGR